MRNISPKFKSVFPQDLITESFSETDSVIRSFLCDCFLSVGVEK